MDPLPEQIDMGSLRLKSYFSRTVEAAMQLARKELGEEALLVDARPALPGTRHLGTYEVVFGLLESADLWSAKVPIPPPLRGAGSQPAASRLVSTPGIASDLSPTLAEAVAKGTPLEDLFTTNATLARVTMLVGPPGAGKTTTLIKLAARYGPALNRRTHIISMDVHRAGAIQHLRALASILGIRCDVAANAAALAQTLQDHRAKELVLIDTPGLALHEMEAGADMARMAARPTEIETHLVLPASMKSAEMARVADAYAWFRPCKLIFTRLDEAARYGALVSEAARQGLPISFLSSGQRIPGDLEPATRRRLVALVFAPGVLDPRVRRARSAGAGA